MLHESESKALEEESFFVSINGKISSQRKFIPIPAMIRLCVRITERMQPGFSISFDAHEWQAFQRFIEVRNALSHPKRPTDIKISKEDLDTSLLSFFWVLQTAVDCIEAQNRALKNYLQEFQGIVEQLKAGNPVMMAHYAAAKLRFEELF